MNPLMNRRTFLNRSGRSLAGVGAVTAAPSWLHAASVSKRPELRITRILIQEARGRRLTPVAPNAYAAYRGYEVREPVLRIQTAQNVEGICHCPVRAEKLKPLLGLDAVKLFSWDGDRVRGVAQEHKTLLDDLIGADVALFDLLGRALRRPSADLLGARVRETTPVYDSSLYMEDLLKPSERTGLAYIQGTEPREPAEWVARKAEWILQQPFGVRVLKIKTGRAKWIESFDAALQRDIAVFKAVRKIVGKDVTLLVDGNDGYKARPLAAAEFAEAVAADGLFAMEEMFPEEKLDETREEKRRARAAGMKTKLCDGEGHVGGIRAKFRDERFTFGGKEEPLWDIDQGDMNQSGYLRLRAKAKENAPLGLTMAPHNFGSKFGLYAMIHLGLVVPNWEFCESDDTQIPALVPGGFEIRSGHARLTDAAGLGVTLREDKLEKPSVVLEV
jgi:L-alanine-DL-glutamate epimerase-like enolase superfamily enzyme